MSYPDDYLWVRTVGAPATGDRRDGELHQILGPLPDAFDLEPWDDDVRGEGYAHYVLATDPPVPDEEGRMVWSYEYRPRTDT